MDAERVVTYLLALERAAFEPVPVPALAEQVHETPRQARRVVESARAAGLVRVEGRRGYVLTAGGRAGLDAWRGRGR